MLSLKNVCKEYYGYTKNNISVKYVVLNKINLNIKEGEFITIVGPSGCGKSTLLNILGGMDQFFIGDIKIDSKPITDTPSNDRIVVFQEGALFPWLTVYQNIEFGLKIAKISKSKRKETILNYIEIVQLTKFTNAFIHQLSGGMKQRVAIARALALNPKYY